MRKKTFIFFATSILLLPSVVRSADDTFACLDIFKGPLVTVNGNGEYGNFNPGNNWTPDTRFDARSAWWRHQTVPDKPEQHDWLIDLGPNWSGSPAPRACFAGGMIIGTNDPDGPWGAVKSGSGAAMNHHTEGGIVDGLRVHNVGEDGFTLNKGRFHFKNVWMTHIWGSVFEDDLLRAGKIEDSYVESLNSISIDPGTNDFHVASVPTVEIDGLLARLVPFNMSDRPYPPWGMFIKARNGDQKVNFEIRNSLFATAGWADDSSATGRDFSRRQALAWSWVSTCSNNMLLWLSDSPIPSYMPMPPSRCFTIKKGAEARAIWSAAVANWINCHPKLQRMAGDPKSDLSKCDSSAYGGGGSGLSSGGTTSGGASGVLGPCNLLNAGDAPPSGYGAPWNPFNASQGLVLNSTCQSNSAELKVGTGPYMTQYVYKQGYVYRDGWQPFTLSGNFVSGSTDWLQGEGSYTLSNPPSGSTYWVGYMCHWDAANTKWKCGCRDAACTQPFWQLQGVKR